MDPILPRAGNLLAAVNIYPGSTTSAITDSNDNTWTQAHTDPGAAAIQYAQNPTTSSTLTVTIPLTNATREHHDHAVRHHGGRDLLGPRAGRHGRRHGEQRVGDQQRAVHHPPEPERAHHRGHAVSGKGPLTGFASGAPATALFMPVTYPGETDFDTFDNADGYAHNYYGTSLTQQNYNWTLAPQVSNSWNAAAVEFKADDTSPPTVPAGLTATAASTSQINLAWTAATDNLGVTGYLVERCQGSGCTAFAQIASVTTTTFSDTGLAAATSYSYRVRATDAAGNLSDYSNTATTTTPASPDTTPPTVPSGLTATAASTSQINLAWTASTDTVGVTGYLVERCQGAGARPSPRSPAWRGPPIAKRILRRRPATATESAQQTPPATSAATRIPRRPQRPLRRTLPRRRRRRA